MPRDDAGLLARAGRGDQSAFDALYNEYETDLYRFVLYLADGPDTADELFQETWFRVVKHLGDKPVANFKQWLFTIATNLYRDELRRRKVRRPRAGGETGGDRCGSTGAEDSQPAAPHARPDAEGFVVREALEKAMNQLTSEQRAVFVLVYVEGFKIREAGEILGKPEGTIKSTLYRAVQTLRKELEEFR
jgi:RNA polymerase sigma-70 factor (ECF subfamily)